MSAVTGRHMIPGYTPEEGKQYEVRFTCRHCLEQGVGVEMTMSKCSAHPVPEDIGEEMECPYCDTAGQFNVEFGWQGRWDDDDEEPIELTPEEFIEVFSEEE